MKKLSIFFAALMISAMAMATSETYTFSSFTSNDKVELSAKTFNLTLTKGNATKPAWSSNQARIYPGGTLVISATSKIAKIEYDYVVNANKSGKVPTIDGVSGSVDAGAWNEESKTWTGSDTKVTFAISGEAGNVGFTSVTVTFKTIGSNVPVKGITATNSKDTVEVGERLTLKYTIDPDSATDQRVQFAIVSGSEYISLTDGVITGVAEGDAQISVTALDSLNKSAKLSATYNIHIKAAVLNTCADVNAAAKDDQLKLNPVTVVYVNGANNYVKDASGSTLVYQQTSGLKAGDVVSGIKGKAAPYYGLPELKPTNATTDWTVTSGVAPTFPDATTAPTAAEVNQVLVWKEVKGMTGDFTTSGKETVKGAFGTDSIAFYNNFKIEQSFDATHSYDITGAVAIYSKDEVTTIQVYFISAKDNGVVTSLINTEAKQQVRKAMINGQMVILRDGTKYNVIGTKM